MDPQLVDTITRLIGNVGFPIFVAIWLLWRTDGLLRELHDAVLALKDAIERLRP